MRTKCESSNFPLHKALIHNVCFSFFLSDWIQWWIKHITECHFVSCSVYHALTTDHGIKACQSELHITISFTYTAAAVAAASVHLDFWFLEFNYEKCSFSTSRFHSNSFLWHWKITKNTFAFIHSDREEEKNNNKRWMVRAVTFYRFYSDFM